MFFDLVVDLYGCSCSFYCVCGKRSMCLIIVLRFDVCALFLFVVREFGFVFELGLGFDLLCGPEKCYCRCSLILFYVLGLIRTYRCCCRVFPLLLLQCGLVPCSSVLFPELLRPPMFLVLFVDRVFVVCTLFLCHVFQCSLFFWVAFG